MCGIYGVLSYKNNVRDMNDIVDFLGMESAERGTDATGIAYALGNNIKVNKQAVSAYKFNPNVPKFVKAVIGHTRHSTQGDKSKNYNNHPWSEKVQNCKFALAHNGVLINDDELQRQYNFKSKIKTDSYVAVQLLKMQNKLDFNSIKFMAESIQGSYSFNILDSDNNIYLVKGDSPISVLHFEDCGVYAFASTPQILWKALVETELFDELKHGNFEEIELVEGDILKIKSNGETEKSYFTYSESFGRRWYDYGKCDFEDDYLGDIKTVAAMYGEDSEIIQELYEQGFSFDELEELIYERG